MKPIVVTYPRGRGLYAFRMHPDLLRFVKVDDADWETFDSDDYADFVIPLTDSYNIGVYSGLPPTMDLDVQPIDIIFERQIADEVLGPPTFGDPAVGDKDTTEGLDIFSIRASVASAKNFLASAGSILTGKAIAGTLTDTQMTTNLVNELDTSLKDRALVFTGGNLKDVARVITGWDGTLKKISFARLPIPVVLNDPFVIL